MRLISLLFLSLLSCIGYAVELGLGPIPPGSSIYSGGSVPATTQFVYSNGTTLLGDSGATRAALAVTYDANTDNTLTTGYGKLGLASAGTTANFYIAQASNYNSTDYALRQGTGGSTFLNTKSATTLGIGVSNVSSLNITSTGATFPATIVVTSNNVTASAFTLGAAGGGISIKSGSNARCGTATLTAGSSGAVANTSVTANTRVMCTVQTPGGTQGFLSTSKVNATSFTITSTSGTETSTVAWELIENP